MSMRPKKFFFRARSAITGRFMRLAEALRNKRHSIVEKVRHK